MSYLNSAKGRNGSYLPWLEDPYLSPRGWPLGTAWLKSSVFQVGLASGRGQQVVGGQEVNEVRDSLPATLAAALLPPQWPLLPPHLRTGQQMGKREEKDLRKFPTTLLLHCMWSEPSCLGKPGNIVILPGDSGFRINLRVLFLSKKSILKDSENGEFYGNGYQESTGCSAIELIKAL